jgi:hypothetical protein
VTFQVSWKNGSRNTTTERSKVWIFVEYRRIQNDVYVGGWLRADIPAGASITAYAGTVERVTGNTKGFWLQGPDTGDFTATLIVPVTVDVSGYDTKFSWCAYASDCPPQAVPTTSGYNLRGEPDFIIQTTSNAGSTVTHNTTTYTDCIYGISDNTGAPGDTPPPVPAISDFTASASSICAGQSVTLTATATNAQRYSFDNGVTWQTAHTKTVSPTVTTTYALKASRTAGGCTVTYPVQQTITVHPTPDVAFVNPPAALCTNATATLSVTDLNSVAGSYCFTYECHECERNPYLTGNNDPAAVGCAWFSECIYSAANTYSISAYDAGTMTVWAKAITGYGCVDSTSIDIVALGVHSPTLTLLSGSDNLMVAANKAIAQIKYTTTNATGAAVTGLPAGVSGAWAANTVTISGTPTAAGAFTYTVTATRSGCIDAAATGTITVIPPDCVPANLTLGEAGFNSDATYSANGLIFSSPVTVTYCNNRNVSDYNGGVAGAYKVDCAMNSYNVAYGNWLSACFVAQYAERLCPSPWRPPTQYDYCMLVYGSRSNCSSTPLSSANLVGTFWPLNGDAKPGGGAELGGNHGATLMFDPTIPEFYSLTMRTNQVGIRVTGRGIGQTYRCVQDAP